MMIQTNMTKQFSYKNKSFFLLLWFVLTSCVPKAEPPAPTPTKALVSAAAAVTPTQLPITPTSTPLATPSSTPMATPSPPATFTPLPAHTPTPEPQATPTETSSPSVQSFPPGEVAFNGVRLQLNARLANHIYPIEETRHDLTYTVFKFAPEGICPEVGCIEVYDVADYEAALPDFPLPPVGAAAILDARNQMLAFQNGDGIRSLRTYGQDLYFANNEDLVYDFQGFTDDDRFYVFVTIPLHSSILISTSDPTQNSNPDAISVPSELPTEHQELGRVMREYNQEITRQFELLVAADFTPDLDLLDALVTSLQIEDPPSP